MTLISNYTQPQQLINCVSQCTVFTEISSYMIDLTTKRLLSVFNISPIIHVTAVLYSVRIIEDCRITSDEPVLIFSSAPRYIAIMYVSRTVFAGIREVSLCMRVCMTCSMVINLTTDQTVTLSYNPG